MAVKDKLNAVKAKLDNIKRDRRFKKANKERALEAALSYEVVKCAGDLGACQKEFFYTIQEQALFIRRGRAEEYNTSIQETQLRDAAIGYLLVKDALFALQSISSYDSVNNAYSLLDAATQKITGEHTFPFFKGGKKKPERTEYGFINSAEAVNNKSGIVDGFFEKLIETGDIEQCIKEAKERRKSDPFKELEAPEGGLPHFAPDINEFSDQEQIRKDLRRTAMFNTTPPPDDKF